MERSRCTLNRYVERFIDEKCAMRHESIGRHHHVVVTSIGQSEVGLELPFGVTSRQSCR